MELGVAGHVAPAIRACCRKAHDQHTEDGAVRVGFFDDSATDLEQARPEGCQFRLGEELYVRNAVAQVEHMRVGAGVQDQPDLIGDRALGKGAVRGELGLCSLIRLSAWPRTQ